MLIQRTDITFNRTGKSPLPNIFPYPQQLGSALKLWLSADTNVALSGSNVTSWTDRSPASTAFTNAGSPDPIDITTSVQNGLPGLATTQTTNAAATSSVLTSAAVSGTTPVAPFDFDWNTPFSFSWAWKVGAFGGTSGDQFIFLNGSGSHGLFIESKTSGASAISVTLQNASGTRITAGIPAYAAGTTNTVTVTYDGSGNVSGFTFYVNGAAVAVTTTIGTTISSTVFPAGNRNGILFGANDGSHPFNSPDMLFELAAVNIELASTQATLMDSYLNKKWALHA